MAAFHIVFTAQQKRKSGLAPKLVTKRLRVTARDSYEALDKAKRLIPGYSSMLYPIFRFGKVKLSMSETVRNVLAGAGPEEA